MTDDQIIDVIAKFINGVRDTVEDSPAPYDYVLVNDILTALRDAINANPELSIIPDGYALYPLATSVAVTIEAHNRWIAAERELDKINQERP